jgi:type II secretory pathway component PulM
MAFYDRLKDRWEQAAPRERRLALLLGVSLLIALFGYIGFQISDGLDKMAKENARTRAAIASLEKHADELMSGKGKSASAIADAPVSLATYLETIGHDVGVELPETTESSHPAKSPKFTEHTIDVTLRNITIDQLAQFLKRVETDQPSVVTQHLNVKPYRSDHVHMDVELTIATYEKNKPKDTTTKSSGDNKDTKGKDKGTGG